MCTVFLYRSHGQTIIAANRDENPARPTYAPARHWPANPKIIAGQDLGSPERGSWMGINDQHLFSGLVNLQNTMGPKAQRKSRGTLVLNALQNDTAEQALTEVMHTVEPSDYQGFHLILADKDTACVLTSGGNEFTMHPLDYGYHLIRPTGYQKLHNLAMPQNPKDKWSPYIDYLEQFQQKDMAACTVSSSLIHLGHHNQRVEYLYSSQGPVKGTYDNIIQPLPILPNAVVGQRPFPC